MSSCRGCNAPLPEGSNICIYCGVHNDVDLSPIGEYTVRRPEHPRNCPDCHTPMQVLDLGGPDTPFLVDRCGTCMGIFLDNGEIDALVGRSVAAPLHADFEALQKWKARTRSEEPIRYRPCPVCGRFMNRQNFGNTSGIIVDRCKEHGLYLDAGELKAIREWWHLGGAIQRDVVDKARHDEEERIRRRAELDKGMPPQQTIQEPSYTLDLGDLLTRALRSWF